MEELISVIKTEQKNPKNAVEMVFDKYINLMKGASSEYLKQRYIDFLDVKKRVISNLNHENISFKNLSACILLVDELLPSMLAEIGKNVKGVIAKRGGYTSHSAILCRNSGIPYVIAEIADNYRGEAIINGKELILNPSKEEIENALLTHQKAETVQKDLGDVKVWANVSNNKDVKAITEEFSGIGLYRTEFLFESSDFAMNVNKQVAVYTQALKEMKGKRVTFRTFDFGDDKKCVFMPLAKKGISTYYVYPKLFATQIEALVKTAKKFPNQVRIMFPMIETIEEYKALKEKVLEVAEKYKVKNIKIGMMLETQRALINLETFKEVEFISIGTNDLTFELFNLDRNTAILYDSVYEELIKIVEKVNSFCQMNNIDLCICGELITMERFAQEAFRKGLKNVSISPNMIKNIYQAINEGE